MDKTRAFFNVYSICIKRRQHPIDHPNYIDLKKCDPDSSGNISFAHFKKNYHVDIHDILKDFFDNYLSEFKDMDSLTNAKPEKKTYVKFKAESVSKDDAKRLIWGEVRAGSSGYPSDISKFETNPETLLFEENVNYNVSQDEHDLCNYFFETYVPEKGHKGTIIFLSLGTKGVVTSIKIALQKFAETHDHGFKIEINPILMKIKGDKIPTVKKIKMISRPKLDVENQNKKQVRRMDKKSELKMTSIITGFDDSNFDWRDFLGLSGKRKQNKIKNYFKEFYELEEDNFKTEYEVEIETEKRKRTLVIQEEMKMSLSLDVTSSLSKDKKGKYALKSLKTEAEKIIDDVDKGYL